MTDQVLAFNSGSVPQTQLLVHTSGDYSAICGYRASCHPVCVAKSLVKELSYLSTCAHVIYSEAVVSASRDDLLSVAREKR